MRTSKPVISAIIVLLLLLFTFINAAAQSLPGNTQEMDDGEEVLGELPHTNPSAEIVNSGLEPPVPPQQDNDEMQADIFPDAVPPLPVVSDYENVYGSLPVFYFTRNDDASRYMIRVWDYSNSAWVYTYKGVGDCYGSICSLKPDIKLNPISHITNGWYGWQVCGKFGDKWGEWSESSDIYVYANGFTSDFSSMKKWSSVLGNWAVISPGYLKTQGYVGYNTSVIEKDLNLDWYSYTVRMKRVNDQIYPNSVYFSAVPFWNDSGMWKWGYAFQYANDNTYRILRFDNGTPTLLRGWTYTPYIKSFDWNTLTVMQRTPYLDFWINGRYLGYIQDNTYQSGFVGIGSYRPEETKSPLYVDSAELKYVHPHPWSEEDQRDPAFDLSRLPDEVIAKPEAGQ